MNDMKKFFQKTFIMYRIKRNLKTLNIYKHSTYKKSNILHLVAVIATTNFLWPVGGKNNFRTNKTTSKFREKKNNTSWKLNNMKLQWQWTLNDEPQKHPQIQTQKLLKKDLISQFLFYLNWMLNASVYVKDRFQGNNILSEYLRFLFLLQNVTFLFRGV